jgi:Cu-processing system permease protein
MVDIFRNRVVLTYTLTMLVMSVSVFSLESNPAKGILTLLNLILFLVPLVSIIFSTIYIYNSAEFIELLVSQPIKRRSIWLSLFLGLSASLTFAFLLGAGAPILLYKPSLNSVLMILSGTLLTLIFVALAMWCAVILRDKAKGIGITILVWMYFAIIFDGIVLFLLFQLDEYPLEKPMMVLSAFNPIDLCRINILLRLDVSALMGYTGAVFKSFFGTSLGYITSILVLIIWIILPLFFSMRKFKSKDL